MRLVEVEFERMGADGAAAGRAEAAAGPPAREVRAYGVFPGERAVVELVRRRGSRVNGSVREILRAHPQRVAPAESHYLSCSPWQALAYPAQVELKKQLLGELFARAVPSARGAHTGAPLQFYEAAEGFGYRNKLEFSFTEENGRLRLAFFARGSHSRRMALDEGCRLGSAAMNAAALEIVEELSAAGIGARALKSLVVRESRAAGEMFAVLFLRERESWPVKIAAERCAGFLAAWSEPRTPASVMSEVLEQRGRQTICERVGGLEIEYPLLGFFQNHAALFERALEEVRAATPECGKIVDLYTGAGVIGLAVAGRARRLLGVESDAASVECARANAKRNGAANFEVLAARAEKLSDDVLAGTDALILDPPRSGLHPKLIGKILAARPGRIVYLSCGPANQARDCALLGEAYTVTRLVGFDFYPQTPHLESLAVLEST